MSNKTKKILALLITVVLCLGIGTMAVSASDILKVAKSTTSVEGTIKAQEKSQSTDSSDKTTNNESEDSTSNNNSGSNSNNNSSNKSQSKSSSGNDNNNETTTSKNSSNTCTLTIECFNILNNMDMLEADKEDYIPSSGYMLKNYTYTLTGNDTVYDVISNAESNGKINLTVQNSSYGKYIYGINSINQKDCGESSGWMYKVNNVSPNVSCSLYKIKGGENIVFYYVI